MVMGHYSTALIPWAYENNRKLAPFWFFLLVTQILDFLMVFYVFAGIESIEPSNFFEASFRHMAVDMTYSHDMLPVIVMSVLFAALAGLVFRSVRLAAIVLGLIALHQSMDLLVGFEHYWFGIPDDPEHATVFGLGLYNSMPVVGILVEAAICGLILAWYLRKRAHAGHPLATGARRTLWIVLVACTLSLLLMANQSLIALVS